MERVMDIEKPDFVMFTGDTIHQDGTAYCRDPRRSLREAVSAVEKRSVPWGLVFGNHDTEYGISREQLMKEVAAHTYSLARSGLPHIHGTGNYVQPIFGSASNRVAALLYALDSGAYSEHPAVGGYDWIRSDQIAWYREQSDAWRKSNQGLPLPALAFFIFHFQNTIGYGIIRFATVRRMKRYALPSFSPASSPRCWNKAMSLVLFAVMTI